MVRKENSNLPKTKWGGVEDTTFKIYMEMKTEHLNMLLNVRAVNSIHIITNIRETKYCSKVYYG